MQKSGKNSKHFSLKYCRYCRETFEITNYAGKRLISHYVDMPTYGLERKPCPKHDPEDNDNIYEEKL